jgi:hypothetical protein
MHGAVTVWCSLSILQKTKIQQKISHLEQSQREIVAQIKDDIRLAT